MQLNKDEKLKPRLLIILNRFVIGGQAVDTIPLAYYLKDTFNILILYGEKEKDEIEPDFLLHKYPGLQLKKINALRRSINPITDIIAFFKLLIVILTFRPHIVHTHGAKSGFLGRVTAFICRVPVIVHTFHGHFFHSYFSGTVSRLIAWVERCLSYITTAAVALSKTQKEELTTVFKAISATKVFIIPLGFDITDCDDPDLNRNNFRKKYALPDEVVAIGIVGRIVPVKNHAMFLRVIAALLKDEPNISAAFFIIGDGEIKHELMQMLDSMHLSFSETNYTENHKVIFTSWITNIDEIMNGLDIIALTSLNEGTPLTLIESQFYQKPLICTNVGGVKDTMQDKVTGYLVKTNDVEDFAEKTKALVDNKRLRNAMGMEGKKLVIERFSKKQEVLITKDFYFALLNQKKVQF